VPQRAFEEHRAMIRAADRRLTVASRASGAVRFTARSRRPGLIVGGQIEHALLDLGIAGDLGEHY
jgi:hypothetical protein